MESKNKIIGGVVVVVIIVLAIVFGTRGGKTSIKPLETPDRSAFLACQDNKAIQVGYSEKQLDLILSDNRQISLTGKPDSSGLVKYTNGDVTFEQSNGTLQLIENGTTTFSNCVVLAEGDAVIIARIGERVAGGGVAVTPVEVIEDSRCPSGVECIQAGTVKLKATLESGAGQGDQTFVLGQGITTEAEAVGLTAVFPLKTAEQEIVPTDYQFFFSVLKRATSTQAVPSSEVDAQ